MILAVFEFCCHNQPRDIYTQNNQTHTHEQYQIYAHNNIFMEEWKYSYWLIRTIYLNEMNACFMQHRKANLSQKKIS